MSTVGQREIATQQRLLGLFKQFGYIYLGHWKERGGSNLEAALLEDWPRRQGHDDKVVGKVLYEFDKANALDGSRTLYDVNRDVYGLLRYGGRPPLSLESARTRCTRAGGTA